MSTGSVPVLVKNAKQLFPGLAAFAGNMTANLGAMKKFKDHQWAVAPQEYKDQKESWDPVMYKRGFSQKDNMFVDPKIAESFTRKEIADMMTFKQDGWKVSHWLACPLALTGGYALSALPFFLANDTWQPSTMPQTPEALAEWREAADLYRYKYAPAAVAFFKFWLEHTAHVPEKYQQGWEDLMEKNDVRRDAEKIAGISKMYECFQPFYCIRRQQSRNIGRAMGIPTFPTWSKICGQARIRDYWELAWNEDMIVIKKNLLDTMSDAELYDYAWRRYLAPYDKNLSREQLLERVRDYHKVLGPEFEEKGVASNIFVVITYCFGYYNDPAYQENHIDELEKNDFESMAKWGKDAYLQRLEFENGPLRDQVEAHSQKKIAEREAKLKALE